MTRAPYTPRYVGAPRGRRPRGTHVMVCCPTCRERFELALHDGGAMWGEEFSYVWPPLAPRWFPRLRAFFRLLVPWGWFK